MHPGVIHIKRAEYARADKYLQTALRLTSDSDAAARARIFADMGANAFAQGLYPKARGHYEQGLRIAESIEARSVVAFLKHSVGTVAHETGMYKLALTYYQQADDAAQEVENYERVAHIYKSLGGIYEHLGQTDAVEEAYLTGLKYTNRIVNPELFIQLNWFIGVYQTQRGHPLDGEAKLKESAALAMDMRFPSLWTGALIALGKFYFQEHKWNVATHTFLEALNRAVQIHNYKLISRAVYGVALAQVSKRYIIGTNDVLQTLQELSLLRSEPIFANVPPRAMSGKFLQASQNYFQLGLINYPGLERYRIVEALRLLFDGKNL